ncbi:hypothetical protein R3P38DRAFT_3388160 [Favolaschia claudopus]|uniref:Aminoglycoside phosphotransferase domain-containing protein n=1 Tax=Favolaschia claudopus TaxID=2862362 RepID=A0AAW0DC88_9AGAR
MSRRRLLKVPSLRFLGVEAYSSSLRPRCLFSSFNPSFTRNLATNATNRLPSRRISSILDSKSLMMDLDSEIFNYTTGRFLANEAYHLSQRRVFDVPGLFEIIAKATNCKTEQITGFRKFGEGGLNRIFLVTLDTGFQLIARIPYPLLIPKAYAIASEVATMDLLRSRGVPNSQGLRAQTEYILMEYMKGTDLSQIWSGLERDEIKSLVDQLVKLEHITMSIASGSIYYTRDLMELALEGDRFCIGPDVSIPLWYGQREWLEVFRGPYKNAESVLITGAKKELAYLDKFGAPRAPYQHFQREYYKYEKQSPLDHVKNLHRYLRLASALLPDDHSLSAFCIRLPDRSDSNIRVSIDSVGLDIVSLLDWQHTAVLPLFLHAGVPNFLQSKEDEVSQQMVTPELPDNFDTLSEEDKDWELLRRRLAHYHYNLSTAAHNKVHHEGLVYPLTPFRRRIFIHASAIWEGETIKLLCAMIDLVCNWEVFATDGTSCPVDFTEEEIEKALKLYQALANADMGERQLMERISYADETWVPVAHYEAAKAIGQELKRMTLKASAEDEETTEEDYALIEANWPLDDMEEDELYEYK